jgi:hypothetical protein
MKCHFMYAVPVMRLRRNIFRMIQQCGLPLCWFNNRQNPNIKNWSRKSPFENTKNIFSRLSERVPTYLYAHEEYVSCSSDSDDNFIGHPYFPALQGKKGTTELTATRSPRPKIFALISPLHCNVSICGNHINKAYLYTVDRTAPSRRPLRHYGRILVEPVAYQSIRSLDSEDGTTRYGCRCDVLPPSQNPLQCTWKKRFPLYRKESSGKGSLFVIETGPRITRLSMGMDWQRP